jgi:hypothetical protein
MDEENDTSEEEDQGQPKRKKIEEVWNHRPLASQLPSTTVSPNTEQPLSLYLQSSRLRGSFPAWLYLAQRTIS